WTLIGEVKNNPRMHIPIIGNGDLVTPQDCKRRFDETGVDAVMIGRASYGQPWIFSDVKHFLETGELAPKQSFSWYLDVLKQQVMQSVQRLDERRGILHIRRHLAGTPIFKGIPDFKPTRIALLRANTVEELFAVMDEIPEKFGIR
ncbi:MAG TPA: tRNA dihydrouridine synthase DusB, partial [Porphyromonadaceae bacterium]|nr:tRNA dihydrouridine synthase DusB [Porphyromonadaceae bacterium]